MRYSRRTGVESAPMQEETVIYNAANGKFCMLNETAAFIWDQLDEPRTAEEISTRLCDSFDGVDFTHAERDVRKALDQLVEQEMVMRELAAAVLGE